MSMEITYDGDVDKAIGFFVTTVDECDNAYLGTEGPLWSKEEMETCVEQESSVSGMGEIIVHFIMSLPVDECQVWANECQLVLREFNNGAYRTGDMGLCHDDGQEIQVRISSFDRSCQHEIFSKLKGVPVRVVISRVPGGNV